LRVLTLKTKEGFPTRFICGNDRKRLSPQN
jgi:hypothetical protein